MYALFSLLFFWMPVFHIRNKFRPRAKKIEGVWTIAHRGGAHEAIENTISTFKRAVDKGVHIIEMDIQITKDKRPVIWHDHNLLRICGVDKEINQLNYDELPPIQDTVELHFSENYYTLQKSDDRKIPLLEEAMKELPDVPFNMELKQNDDDLKKEVLKLIRKYERESITIWGSWNEEHWMKMKKMAPDVPTFTPINTILKIGVFFLLGFLPFYRLHHDTFQFPFSNDIYVRDIHKHEGNNLHGKIKILFTKLFNFLSRLIFYHLRERRIFVFYYSLNTIEDIDSAVKWNIDGIISDCPELLVNHLSKKKD